MHTFLCLLASFFIVKIILFGVQCGLLSTIPVQRKWERMSLHPTVGPFCCPSEMKGGKQGSKAGFEVDSQPGTQGSVQEPQPDQSYSSVVTPAL